MGNEGMVMTILEAHVAAEQWATLKQTFAEGSKRTPPQMVQMFLVQGTADPTLWQGISVWRSREALEEYRRSVQTPGGILMFRSVGAEPTLTISEVVVAVH
jgi:hypothetical protein